MNYLVISGNDLKEIPETPLLPTADICDLSIPKKLLLNTAKQYGYPVSYIQEQNGALIQNIIPVHQTELEQISTSSRVELALHTETAFHPHKPDYVLLLCLRGDSSAVTTLADVNKICADLDKATIDCLLQPWFTTGVDKSFRGDDKKYQNTFMETTTPILFFRSDIDGFQCVYDHDSMKGTNSSAQLALELFNDSVVKNINEIVLDCGDLLIINNNKIIHGRKIFQPKYNGTDRWVQRLLVKKNLNSIKDIERKIVEEYETFLIKTELNSA